MTKKQKPHYKMHIKTNDTIESIDIINNIAKIKFLLLLA